MTFVLEGHSGDGKAAFITDDASDLRLSVDCDDVNPEDVTTEKLERIVKALNDALYGDPQSIAIDRLLAADMAHSQCVLAEQATYAKFREAREAARELGVEVGDVLSGKGPR